MGEKGHSAGEHSLQRRPTACCPTPGGHRCRAGALGACRGGEWTTGWAHAGGGKGR